jgi:predicted O-methyltransferase YrrM
MSVDVTSSVPIPSSKERDMSRVYEADDWQQYVMRWYEPHREIEPLSREVAVVQGALATLVEAGILPNTEYDRHKMLAHRKTVRDRFEIPWTAISPRMQRLLYAINAIAQPEVMVAVGVFCGNTFISNAGAAIGPGASYRAKHVVGIEIRPAEAARARRNVATIHTNGDGVPTAEILATDGISWLRDTTEMIDLLYLDADGPHGTKSIYLELLQAGLHALQPRSLVLAHNSVNAASSLTDYLAYVRDPAHFRESVNMIVDDQGLEVSMR